MRRFDTLLQALDENRADAVIASIAVDAGDARSASISPIPYYRTPARFVARRDTTLRDVAAGDDSRARRSRWSPAPRTRPISRRSSPRPSCALSATWRRRARRCARARSICCSATASRSPSGSTARTRPTAAPSRRPVHREPLFRRGHRHRGPARQRHAAARLQLGAVPAVGEGPLHRSVAALFSDQPVLRRLTAGAARFLVSARRRTRCRLAEATAASLRELAEQLERLAVRGGAQDRRAAEEASRRTR